MISKKNILGVDITDATKKKILEYIVENLKNFRKKLFIVTPNPEFLVLAHKNSTFKNILNKADLASADGIGVIVASKILGKPLKDRFAGVDLVKSLCETVAEKPITVGFLGGRGRVAEKTAECLQKKYPGLKVGFVGEEWPKGDFLGSTHSFDDSLRPSGDTQPLLKDKSTSTVKNFYINKSKESLKSSSQEGSRQKDYKSLILNHKSCLVNSVDVLFVAYGVPKQEFWINDNLDKLPVKVAIGVGGTFDYLSGKIPRAPSFIRSIGLEWLFRLAVQPWRIKRQLSLIEFVWLIVKEKLTGKRD